MFSLYFNETASSKWTGNHKKPCFPPESGIFIYWQLSFIFCFLCDEEPHASLPIPWSGDWVDIFESSLSPAVYHYLWIVVSFFFGVYTLMCPVCPTAYFSCEISIYTFMCPVCPIAFFSYEVSMLLSIHQIADGWIALCPIYFFPALSHGSLWLLFGFSCPFFHVNSFSSIRSIGFIN